MSVEALNAQGATPEFILHKALEVDPRFVVILLVDKNGQQFSMMSHMKMQDLAAIKLSFDSQMMKFFSADT